MAPSAVTVEPEALETAPFAGKKQAVASIEVPKPQQEEPSLLHRSLLERPHTVTRASRSYLYLEDGRKVLDACGGAAVAILGHGHPEVLDAVMDQMRKVSYVHTVAYTTESAEALANWIIGSRRTGFDHGLAKAYFIGSGSEANDAAMKCARQYWFEKGETQRKFFISRQQAYHGNTIGAMSVSSLVGRKIPYQDVLLPNVAFVSPADAYHGKRAGETDESFVQRLMDELEAEILRLGPENVISFIGETVSGAALGSMPAPPGYWRAVRAMCDKYGILLHLDEIMCGAGRTGSYFAFEQEGMRPDIVTIGKGLGGGYAPIAGMLINDKIVDSLRKGTSAFNHGHTYQAHPVSCAAALAVQRVLERDHLIERVAASADGLEAALRKTFANCAYVGDIRGRGFFWTLEFVKNKETKEPFERSVNFGPKVQNTAFELGVALYPGAGTVDGVRGDHITIAPPYMASNEELTIAVSLLKKAYDIVEESVLNLSRPAKALL